MASKNNNRPQSTNAKKGKSKGKNKVSETTGYPTSPLAGIQSHNVVEVGTLDALGRLVITPDEITGFVPSTQSTNVAVMDSIKSFYCDAWTTWREIPVFDRDQIWNHFKMKCAWFPQHEYQIFCNFEIKAAYLLDDIMRTVLLNDQKPDWMLEGIWGRLCEKWKRVAQASDKGDSLHTRGSVDVGTHRQRLEKKKGRTLAYDEVFEEKHVKNKKDGHRTLVESHAERTNVGFKKNLDEWHQSQPTSEDDCSNQSSDDDEASVLPEATGGGKKGSQSQNFGEVEKLDAFSRLIIAPDEITGIIPSTQFTNVVIDCIRSFYRDAWTTWKEIPIFDRGQMWSHFRTKCAWYLQHEYQIFCKFEIKAAYVLYGMMSTAWKRDQKPGWMLDGIWAILSEKSKKFQTMHIQEMVARASDKDDSLQTGGSVGIGIHRRRLKKGRTMTYDEVVEKKHVKNKKDGHRTLIEPHVERTNVGCRKSLDDWRQSQPTSEDDSSNQSSDDDEASILPEAIGGVKKGKDHNLGSQRCLACQEEIDSLRRQVEKLSKKQKRDRLSFARMENLVQNLIDICRSVESDYDSDGED